MSVATCPAAAVLESLFLGGAPEQEVEALEEHVLHCGACLGRVNKLALTQDSLAGVLRDDTQCDALDCGPVVEDLMKKLEALRPATVRSQPQGTPMIAFPCSGCQKPLQVKDTFAGKKVSCPACCQVTVVPAHAAVALAANDDLRTLPPAPAQADEGTPPPVSNPDGTLALEPRDTDRDSSLTAFLAPPQADGELGRLGKYRILKILGHGGMGVVYKAEDPKLKRSVALKAMLPSLAASASAGKRFLREAEAMAAVEHDHIVRIYQVDEDRGVPFLAMEFLKGEALDERLKREDKLPLAEVLRIGREIAEGLAAAHATGLIHRDIKPGNIWLEASPGRKSGEARVKILDFGLARAASQDAGLTQQGAIVGTPAYMAPEQAQGDSIDGRCDLFSLGVVLYRLCSGQQPFQGNDTVSTLMAVAMHKPVPPITLNADLPSELSDLVMQLLEKDPARRIASAAVVVEVLQSMEKQLARIQESQDHTLALNSAAAKRAADPSRQGSAAASAKAPTPPRRRGLVVVAAAAGALALVVAGIVLFWQTPSGTVRIEINDPDIQVSFDKKDLLFKNADKQDIRVSPGAYGLHVKREGLEFDTDKPIVIKKGETVTLKIEWFRNGKLQVVQGDKVIGKAEVAVAPLDPAWPILVAALPAEKQVKAVADKLKERNPGFDGKVKEKIEGGVVTELELSINNVTDISPVRAFTGLRKLVCNGNWPKKGQLADLSPLKDMKLTELRCSATQVSDLLPLKGMKLVYLDLANTAVSDLSPLKDMKLMSLTCAGTRVSDLSPLKDMKLSELWCDRTLVSDLSPLTGMKLTKLHCESTKVTDLSPLKGIPLKTLGCDFQLNRDAEILRSITTLRTINGKDAKEVLKGAGTTPLPPLDPDWLKRVAALPAKEQVEAVKAELMKRNPDFDGKGGWSKTEFRVVTSLEVPSDNVTDISPVQALTGLRTLYCIASTKGKRQLADLSPLKDMPLTELSIYRTSVSDLSALKNMKLTRLNCAESLVTDLSPLKDVPLTHLDCGNTKVSDLNPLKDMKLITFFANNTWVSDLSPLKGMPLTEIVCQGTPVADLSPLKDMKLTRLWIFNTKVTDLSPLRGMPLEEFTCRFKAERDTAILRSLTTLKRINEKAAAEFWRELGLAPVAFPPLDPAWLKAVAAMPPEKQVEAVKAELVKRNPGFDVKIVTHKIDGGVVRELEFVTDNVTDIAPVRGLTGLHTLTITSSGTFWERHGKLADLSPLKDLKLNYLFVRGTEVSDLSPLKDMKLKMLGCDYTKVADLGPLKDMKLEWLGCSGTQVTDLSPLKDMQLTSFYCAETKAADLSPLKDMKLTLLYCSKSQVPDLSVLRGMPLNEIYWDFRVYRDAEILRSIKTLKTINHKPAAQFWKDVDAQQAAFDGWAKQVAALPAQEQVEAVKAELMKRNPDFDGKIVSHGIEGGVVTSLDFRTHNVTDISPMRALIGLSRLICSDAGGTGGKLADLSPLKDMRLTILSFSNTKVSDLSPLKDMPLAILYCNSTPVSDLSPLKDMKLTALFCDHTQVTDLSLLKGMPLKTLHCDFVPKRDAEILRSIPTLEAINNRSAQEFWKEVDAKKVEQDP